MREQISSFDEAIGTVRAYLYCPLIALTMLSKNFLLCKYSLLFLGIPQSVTPVPYSQCTTNYLLMQD